MRTPRDSLVFQHMRVAALDGDVQRLPQGHTTGWRTLPFLMLSHASTGSERLHREGAPPLVAATGELFVLPPGVRHKVDVAGRAEVRSWIHVNVLLFNSLDLTALFDLPVLVRGAAGAEAGRIIRAWSAGRGRGGALAEAAGCHEVAFHLLRLLAPWCRPRPGAFRRAEQIQRFAHVIRLMHDQFGRTLRRDELAATAGLSPAQFHLAFKQATGTTPGEYLGGIRLREAQQFLITSSRPIKEIAQLCGYQDPFTFSKFFSRACGRSPAEYRRLTRLR